MITWNVARRSSRLAEQGAALGGPRARRRRASGGDRDHPTPVAGGARPDRAAKRPGLASTPPTRPASRRRAGAPECSWHRQPRSRDYVRDAPRSLARDRGGRRGRLSHRPRGNPLRPRSERRERLDQAADAAGRPRRAGDRPAGSARGLRGSQHPRRELQTGEVMSFAEIRAAASAPNAATLGMRRSSASFPG